MQIKNRKGAVELSVGTIVILVIGMTMLILGIALVRTIFQGATDSVDKIDEGVKAELNKLFESGDKKVVVRLPNNEIKIKKGDSVGIAFAIRNTIQGESQAGMFSYQVKAVSVETGCSLPLTTAQSYVRLNGERSGIPILPGDEPAYFFVKIQPSSSAPLCSVAYDIEVKKDGQPYAIESFIVQITGR